MTSKLIYYIHSYFILNFFNTMPNFSDSFSTIRNFLFFFTKKLRLSNPWNYKVPFLLSIPYLVLLVGGYNEGKSFYAILASLSVIIGIAGFGYLTNDLGDRQKDQMINKENVTGQI